MKNIQYDIDACSVTAIVILRCHFDILLISVSYCFSYPSLQTLSLPKLPQLIALTLMPFLQLSFPSHNPFLPPSAPNTFFLPSFSFPLCVPPPSRAEVVVEYEYDALHDDELTLRPGDIIKNVRYIEEDGWMEGDLNGKRGLFPDNFVKVRGSRFSPCSLKNISLFHATHLTHTLILTPEL